MVKQHYRHGGEKTPQYYCSKCKHAHTIHSKIGKEHKKLIIKEFEGMKDLAELKALSKHSLENSLTDKQYNRMMELTNKLM